MKFDLKKYLPFLGIAIFLILVVNMFFPLGGLLAQTSGTILGLSNVAIIDNGNNQINSNQVWRATVVLTNGGERLIGEVQTPFTKLVEQATGIRSTNNFKIGYELKKYDVYYPLLQYGTEAQKPQLLQAVAVPVTLQIGTPQVSVICAGAMGGISRYHAGLPTINLPLGCESDYDAICRSNGGNPMISNDPVNIWGITLASTTGKQCIKPQASTNYQWYEARSPQTTVEVDVTATAGVDERTVTLTTAIPQRADSGGVFSAQLLPGGLASFSSSAPSFSSFKVAKLSDNTYVSISTSDYNNLISAVPNYRSFNNRQDYDTALRSYNDRVRQLSSIPYSSVAGFERTQQGAYSSNGYTIDLKDNPAIFPTLVIDINADWVGIERLIANGRISDVSSCQLRANGQSADLNVNVRNNGSRGDLRVSTSCNGITVSPSTYISNVYEAGATLSNRFTLTSSSSGTKSCTVTVQTSNASITDSRTISCGVAQECNAQPINLQRVDSNCNVYCPASSITCGSNEVLDETQCRCVARPINSGICTQGSRITPSNAQWDTVSCTFKCTSGYSANAQGACVQIDTGDNQLNDIWNLIKDNFLYIVGGACAVVVAYFYFGKRGKKK